MQYQTMGPRNTERARLEAAADPRIRQRVYAYVDEGSGIRPEAGVGGFAHRVDLRNLYDSSADPLRLNRYPLSHP